MSVPLSVGDSYVIILKYTFIQNIYLKLMFHKHH
jgi:hypothetical protein